MTTLIIDTDKLLQWTPVPQTDKELADDWHSTDPARDTWPEAIRADTRVDVRFACGDESSGRRAKVWAWGDAGTMTITHWRLSK